MMVRGRLLLLLATLAGAASAVSPAAQLKSNYELALHAQRLTEAMVANRPHDVYRAFTPAFAAEHSFASFDSAFARWFLGRRIVRARHKVVDIQGPSGYVSSWFVFEGRKDYDYVYQNWLNTDQGWQLVWMSRVLDTSFSYGQNDTRELMKAAEAGLRYVLSDAGVARLRGGFRRPDTLVILRLGRPGEGDFQVDGLPIRWATPNEVRAGADFPRAQFLLSLALVRIIGDMALVAVDVMPTGRDAKGKPKRRRGMEVYLKRTGKDWRFRDVGKVW